MPGTTTTIDVHTRNHWSDTERRNVEAVTEFVELLMNAHDFDTLRETFGASSYTQHSRGIAEGIDGLIGYVETLTRRYPEYQYDVKHVHVDGEFVTFHSHATIRVRHRGDERKGFNIIDTWRVVDGQIVEHWDAIQPLSASMRFLALLVGGRKRNENGVF